MKKIILFVLLISMNYSVRGQSDGSLDLSFDGDGMVTTDFGGFDERAHAVAFQTDGKMVVVGYTNVSGGYDWAIVRYNIDGSLDTTFNTNGKVVIDFAGGTDRAHGVAIQSNGKIVVSGVAADGQNYFGVARLNTDGSLDTSFDTDGLATGATGRGKEVAIQSDGKIVVAGDATGVSNLDFAVVRYNTDGSLDTLFDGDGKVTTAIGIVGDYAEAVDIQPDGKIVISGYYDIGFFDKDFAVVRYNSDGSLDTTFGADGIVTTDITPSYAFCYGAALQADGKIVTTGYYNDSGVDIPVVRYNSDGSLDTTFDTDGIKILGYTHFGIDVAIQSDNKIVIAADGTTSEFFLFRCNTDGSLDTAFDADGVVETDFIGSAGGAWGIAIQSDGKIVAVGQANNDFAVARYNVFVCATAIYDTLSLCQGDSVFLAGNYQFTSGVYYDSLLSVDSCDSVIATTLIVDPANFFTPDVSICAGDSALLFGVYQTTIGTYYDSLTATSGCDSIISTYLIVNSTYSVNTSDIIICAGDSTLIFGVYQSIGGTYYDSLITVDGCDSIIATNLTVNQTYSISDTLVSICNGDSASIYGSYQATAGTYYDSLTTNGGCDSIRSTVLTVNTTYNLSDPAVAICTGDSALIYGVYKTTGGTYFDSLITINGCDSVRSTVLTFNPTYSTSTSDEIICDGDSVMIFGIYRKNAGTYYDSLNTVNSCDSVIITTLTVNPTYATSTSDVTICANQAALIFGVFQTTAGTYYDSLTTSAGCDSIISTILIVDPLPNIDLGTDTTICSGCSIALDAGAGFTSYDWSTGENTQTIDVDSAGTYTVQVTDANGCVGGDAIVVNIVSGTNQSAISNHQSLIVYPNPNTGRFTLEIDLQENTELSIQFYHFTGQLIHSEEIRSIAGTYTQQINLSEYAKGVYYVQVVTEAGVLTKKFVYQ